MKAIIFKFQSRNDHNIYLLEATPIRVQSPACVGVIASRYQYSNAVQNTNISPSALTHEWNRTISSIVKVIFQQTSTRKIIQLINYETDKMQMFTLLSYLPVINEVKSKCSPTKSCSNNYCITFFIHLCCTTKQLLIYCQTILQYYCRIRQKLSRQTQTNL